MNTSKTYIAKFNPARGEWLIARKQGGEGGPYPRRGAGH